MYFNRMNDTADMWLSRIQRLQLCSIKPDIEEIFKKVKQCFSSHFGGFFSFFFGRISVLKNMLTGYGFIIVIIK